MVERDPNRCPTHPGALLRDIVLPGADVTVKDAARLMGISRQTLHRILAEKGPITPEMALRIGKFAGNGPGLWLRMQQSHDLWRAKQKLRDEIEGIPTIRAA